ncbi:MAG: dUTP pyrophosphatase [Oscillospiraceae bacterium]
MTKIKFAKASPNAIVPSKDSGNGGYDMYACFEAENIVIQPQKIVMIPTGICSVFDDDYVMVAKERGSTGSKGMAVRCGIVDSSYRGEIFIAINNTGDKPILITKEKDTTALQDDYIVYPYTKAICQMLLLPVPKVEIEEISYDELQAIKSTRMDGKLGSSGK